MRYYKLVYDYEKDDNYVNCNKASIGNMDKYIINKGIEIKEWRDVIFEYKSTEGDVLTDYLANLYRWLLVSSNFQRVTNNILKDQVQYLPVTIIDQVTKIRVNSYHVANIIAMVDALDMKKSKYNIFELNEQKIYSFEKYALRESKIEDKHIFRLKDETIPIFVSEILKKIIKDNHLTGFEFLEVEVN